MDLDACEKTVQMRQKAAQSQVLTPPKAVGDAVQPEGVQARIAGQHLQGGAGCRILGKRRPDILAHPIDPAAQKTGTLAPGGLVSV